MVDQPGRAEPVPPCITSPPVNWSERHDKRHDDQSQRRDVDGDPARTVLDSNTRENRTDHECHQPDQGGELKRLPRQSEDAADTPRSFEGADDPPRIRGEAEVVTDVQALR